MLKVEELRTARKTQRGLRPQLKHGKTTDSTDHTDKDINGKQKQFEQELTERTETADWESAFANCAVSRFAWSGMSFHASAFLSVSSMQSVVSVLTLIDIHYCLQRKTAVVRNQQNNERQLV